MIGFVVAAGGPRSVQPPEIHSIIEDLKSDVDGGRAPCCVALTVNADDALLMELAHIVDALQFHGDETPARVRDARAMTGLKCLKAIGVAGRADIDSARAFESVVDGFIFDAKPSPGADQRGGLGRTFDWDLLKAYSGETPFMVAGGLTPENVGKAIKALAGHSSFAGVDVSSGVEAKRGDKSTALVSAFVAEARSAFEGQRSM